MQQRGSSRVGLLLVSSVVAVAAATTIFAVENLDLSAPAVEDSRGGPGTSPSTGGPSTTTTTQVAETTSTTVTPTTTTTTPPTTTTTTTTPPQPPVFRAGESGPEVEALQQRLIDLGFWLPGVDGNYGPVTVQAVMAFQKAAGLGRDGIAGPATLAALETSAPVLPVDGGDHIEVDLERQLMFVVRGGASYVFNTSTGTAGWRTPPGRFEITRAIDGLRRAPLGDLYRPRYFNGGIALHGSPSIPGHPASHGCTRLHNAAVDFIWANDLAPLGTPVWLY